MQRGLHVLTRQVSPSFAQALQAQPARLDVQACMEEHEQYLDLMRAVPDVEVLEVHADADCPDCVFIEDIVVHCQGTTIVTNPGSRSRRPEAVSFLDWLTLQPAELRAILGRLLVMPNDDGATLDGGDVLQIEDHVFVGQSARSNVGGLEFLQAALPGMVVVPVKVPSSTLHLKSLITATTNGLVAHQSEAGEEVAREVSHHVPHLPVYFTPSLASANVVQLGSSLLVNPMTPEDYHVLSELAEHGSSQLYLRTLHTPEVNKADGALTCCSVIIS
ncbi:uncharacterized protein MONBRDRAFT_15669 [Monosiga brevicollis MX1]|uniref:Uncharacterized protein n=1 Tax=Monosiga brevicollis TaxID=81824 RepID=A9UUH0_MONBE|nr:uncharacterized protein MONBRDRAFT_15669 [Monosiga brevicollis MX1]EDQ90900.1 predicted protein [Monosiga brevicollis MX1]|eukprot:XP_001744197.1 hypothetical protein [Monosiga brevicollis MX1]